MYFFIAEILDGSFHTIMFVNIKKKEKQAKRRTQTKVSQAVRVHLLNRSRLK